jgi:hypothetical protein
VCLGALLPAQETSSCIARELRTLGCLGGWPDRTLAGDAMAITDTEERAAGRTAARGAICILPVKALVACIHSHPQLHRQHL